MIVELPERGCVYEYRIFHDDHGPGKAVMVARMVRDYSPEIFGRAHPLYDRLIKDGLQPDDTIMHVNNFYPHGEDSSQRLRKHIGKGIGTEVLQAMMEKSKEIGAKAIWCNDLAAKLGERSFFDRKGFILAGTVERYHLL